MAMPNILVACGAGVVTSTTAMAKIKDALSQKGYQEGTDYKLTQCSVAEVAANSSSADMAVTTTQYDNDEIKIPVLNGLPLLTGIGYEPIIDKIENLIKKSK